ncbi:MAG: type II toxin-antitoxin system VapC family toxin [Bacteroidales bacterium]|nr:type II toxin-antitoxin system VapC family toxin [Bacteroidales bacterium]
MVSQRIYIDTSVIGGYFDKEFEESTKRLFEKVNTGEFKLVISDLTQSELLEAPEKVRNIFKDLNLDYEVADLNDEAIELAEEYIGEKIVGQSSWDDCLHIAIATINKVDILVSWNFKHIVNIKKIRGFNSINIKNGYHTLEIRSPKEVIDYEEE